MVGFPCGLMMESRCHQMFPGILVKIRAYIQKNLDCFQFKVAIDTEEVRETSDWGFARGTYSFEITPKEEGEKIRSSGKFLTILEKQDDGSWKITRDIFNYNAPRP